MLTGYSLLSDVLRDQLHRLVSLDEDAAQRSPDVLRYFWAKPELFRLCPRTWLNMGRYTIRARGQSTEIVRYP